VTAVGSVGMGLVWGWLLVLIWRDVPGKRPLRHFLAGLLATTLLIMLAAWLTDWLHGLVFVGTAVFSFTLHLAWRTKLRNEAQHL
jgi:NhaP-type Na+/H+ or K+/H+ antiporter